jgi:pyruvate-formate lyase
MTGTERIVELRKRLFKRKRIESERFMCNDPIAMARSLRDSEGVGSWQVRRGLLVRDILRDLRIEIDDLELLAGRLPTPTAGTTATEAHAEALRYLGQFPLPPGQTGHCELDLSRIMDSGIDGLSAEIRGRMGGSNGEAADVYQSFLYALDGLAALIEHAAETAEAAMDQASADRRKELAAISASCRRLVHDRPRCFRDAIQLVWFVTFAVMQGDGAGLVVPGHLDRVLSPFYENGRTETDDGHDDPLLLIESLYLLINDYVPDGLAMSVMVGGRDAHGRDVTNEISYLCLEALRRTNMIYPTVGVCWHDETPDDLVDLAVELIGKGYPTPAFFGDETIQSGMKALGVPAEQRCYYINSTCVEITPAQSSNVWVASPYFNTCGVLLEEIADQVEAADPAADFEAFRERYFERLAQKIACDVEAENQARKRRREWGRKPLQSVFTRDCIERGRDIDDGGARYNWVECSFVGLANLVDSFHVIREEVFTQGRLSVEELKSVLDDDFEGREALRRRFLDGYPKYGQDCGDVDRLFVDAVARLREECSRHRMEPDGSPFVPGAFCWIMHEVFGRDTGATPDGRKGGTAFADGCGPAQGREKLGPTAAIISTTSWDHRPMLGGAAFNMKFSAALFNASDGFAALRSLILTFLRLGGFEIQVNVVDAARLREAREHPEAHRDLIVRIAGYADYFTRLSPEMQDEIIMRTEYSRV